MRSIKEFRCLLISPSDVSSDRDAVAGMIQHWNGSVGAGLGVRIDLVRWETHSVPDLSRPPQEVLDDQLLRGIDVGVALFWSRIGTTTGLHESGSVQEIKALQSQGTRLLVYLCRRPMQPDQTDLVQLEKLEEFARELKASGLLSEYRSEDELQKLLILHLTNLVLERIESDVQAGDYFDRKSTVETLPMPDFRVRTQPAFFMHPSFGKMTVLQVRAENHSPRSVFIRNFHLKLSDGNFGFAPQDLVTRRFQQRIEVRPGETIEFHYTREQLLDLGKRKSIATVMAIDDLGNSFEASKEEFMKTLAIVLG